MEGRGVAHRRNSVISLAAALAVLGAMALVSSRRTAADSPSQSNTNAPVTQATTTPPTYAVPFDDRWRFVDSTASAGLGEATASTDATGEPTMFAALGLADFNGDGVTDVVASRPEQENLLMLGDGNGKFALTPEAGGIEGPRGGTGAFAIADVDADGDNDVFTSSTSEDTNRIFLNDGSGRFSDMTAELGILEPTRPGEAITSLRLGATFHDWDRDGDQDLLVLHWDPYVYPKPAIAQVEDDLGGLGVCEAGDLIRGTKIGRDQTDPPNLSRMYRNDGGRFVDVTSASGIDFGSIVAFTPTFIDLNEDGIDDLLITGDGCTSRGFINDGIGHFTEPPDDLGLNVDENGMGSVVADLDQDGVDDWFVTAIAYDKHGEDCPGPGFFTGCRGNAAYVRRADGYFVDKAAELGLADGGWGWGVVWADLDNSGAPDLAMTNGYRSGIGTPAPGEDSEENRYFLGFETDPMRLWQATPTGFREVAAASGLLDTAVGTSQGRSIAAFDGDGDGDLDLLVNSVDQGINYIENQLDVPNHWIEVDLRDPLSPGNLSAIGSEVTLTFDGRTTHRRVATDGGYGSVGLPLVHFGLGAASEGTALRLEVRWPDGTQQTVDSPAVDQRIKVVREY